MTQFRGNLILSVFSIFVILCLSSLLRNPFPPLTMSTSRFHTFTYLSPSTGFFSLLAFHFLKPPQQLSSVRLSSLMSQLFPVNALSVPVYLDRRHD